MAAAMYRTLLSFVFTIVYWPSSTSSQCFDVYVSYSSSGDSDYPGEVSWYITEECKVSSGFDIDSAWECCLPQQYTVSCQDSFGDGWHGSYLIVSYGSQRTKICESFTYESYEKNETHSIPETCECPQSNQYCGCGLGSGLKCYASCEWFFYSNDYSRSQCEDVCTHSYGHAPLSPPSPSQTPPPSPSPPPPSPSPATFSFSSSPEGEAGEGVQPPFSSSPPEPPSPEDEADEPFLSPAGIVIFSFGGILGATLLHGLGVKLWAESAVNGESAKVDMGEKAEHSKLPPSNLNRLKYVFMRFREQFTRNTLMILSLFDFCTDFLFVVDCKNFPLQMLSFLSLIALVSYSMLITLHIVFWDYRSTSSPDLTDRSWVTEFMAFSFARTDALHKKILGFSVLEVERADMRVHEIDLDSYARQKNFFAIVTAIACSNLEVMTLFPWKKPNVDDLGYDGFPSKALMRTTYVSMLVEDIPQLVIQACYISLGYATSSSVSMLSLGFAFATVVTKIFTRAISDKLADGTRTDDGKGTQLVVTTKTNTWVEP